MNDQNFWSKCYQVFLTDRPVAEAKALADQVLKIKNNVTNTEEHQNEKIPSDNLGELFGTTHWGQYHFYLCISNAGKERSLMAKIALEVANQTSNDPVSINNLINGLTWRNLQATLSFLNLNSSTKLEWGAMDLHKLKGWATE